MYRYLVVDDRWAPVGEFQSENRDWAPGMEFLLGGGRCFAIVGIVLNRDATSPFSATWMVEPTLTSRREARG